jgi:hypothetical protein
MHLECRITINGYIIENLKEAVMNFAEALTDFQDKILGIHIPILTMKKP